MSIKDLVDGAKHLLNELEVFISDLLTWFYHREWSFGEVAIIAIILVIFVMSMWIADTYENIKMKKKEKSQDKKAEQSIDNKGFSRLGKIENSIREKKK